MSVAALAGVASCAASGGDGAAPATTARPATTVERSTSSSTSEADRTTTTDGSGSESGDTTCPDTESVAKIVGADVDRITALGSYGGDIAYELHGCSFDRTDDQGSADVVRLTPSGGSGADLFAKLEESARNEAADHGFEPVDGLGDEAYRNGRELLIRRGRTILLISFTPEGGDDDVDEARRVAKLVLPLSLPSEDPDCDRVAAALADLGTVDTSFGGGGVTAANDASIQYEGCIVRFDDGDEAEVNVAPDDAWKAFVAAKSDSVFTHSFDQLSIGELAAFDDGEELFVDGGDRPWRISTDDLPVSEDQAARIRRQLAELAVGG